MVEEATRIPGGPKVDGLKALGDASGNPKLRVFPDPAGVQHCEIAGMRDTIERRVPWFLRRFTGSLGWKVKVRTIDPHAEVHPSVTDRFAMAAVDQCAGLGPYRPSALAGHEEFKSYYGVAAEPSSSQG